MTQSLSPKSIVLYADDDQDDIELVKDAFSHFPDVEVVAFADGEALLSYAKHLASSGVSPCLIILDINMPRMNGKETLKMLRNEDAYEDIPIILFTTSTLPSEAAFAKSFNAGFVTKPLRADQITLIADTFIEHCSDEIKRKLKELRKR